ncbi:MAG: BatA and WFA domain-containing protein [Gemmatimonadales bacterium]
MIGFLYPWALVGLAAAAIPLLLHLREQQRPPTVPFPAVRYLQDATRRHERRLQLRHWLLLALRTLLVVAVVFAGAGPTVPLRHVGPHAPTALVLVVDNSLSSGVTAGGTPRIDRLRTAARAILSRAGAGDQLWLLASDGIPRRGTPASLRGLIDSLKPSGARMDLGATITLGARILAGDGRPGGVVVLTDLQASAVSAADVHVPVLVADGSLPRIVNVGIARVDPGPEPWGLDGGRVTVTVVGDSTAPRPVTVTLAGRPGRQALAGVGRPATVTLPGTRPGWYALDARLDPDELRADDDREVALRIAPPVRLRWDSTDRYLAAALATLADNGRVVRGDELQIGRLGAGASVVLPPVDPAAVGALNRTLAARGVPWRFGALAIDPAVSDSGAWLRPTRIARRYRLVAAGSGRTGVAVTAGGEPWVVRAGNVVLIGSRFDPAWTDLPVSAAFVPFVDALVNRLARGEVVVDDGTVGASVLLPDAVSEVRRVDARWAVEGGAGFTPPSPGLYWLLSGRDTIGALAANADPRESLLAPASASLVRSLWPSARVLPLADAVNAAFALSSRTDLRGPLLWAALLLALAELVVAGWGGRVRAR